MLVEYVENGSCKAPQEEERCDEHERYKKLLVGKAVFFHDRKESKMPLHPAFTTFYLDLYLFLYYLNV